MDSYQAIYDAVRSRIHNGDIGSVVERVMQDVSGSLSDYAYRVSCSAQSAISSWERPSAIYRPKLSIDGNMWIALYGDNLQDGCVGCGESPELAMRNFDKEWEAKFPQKEKA